MLETLSVSTASVALAIGVFSIAVGLLFWLRFERSRRGLDLSDADQKHFSRQDVRRNAGIAILLLVAQGIAVSPQIDRQVGGRPGVLFLLMWLLIFLLIFALLALAFVDMLATRKYANRHRDAILRERSDLLVQFERLAQRQRDSENDADIGCDSK
jgi:hypothetical protein